MTCNTFRRPYSVQGRLWIDGPEGTFLGFGRTVLLERIQSLGSISAAARSMQMSYRHAWELVESMNRQAPHPLVRKVVGGSGGGGAELTEAGLEALATFHDLQQTFLEFLEQCSTNLPWLKEDDDDT